MDSSLPDGTGFVVNGAALWADPAPGERLSHTLRERLGQRDVKVGCNAGDCGACTVLIDGLPVCACLTPAHRAAGRQIETAAALCVFDPVGLRLSEAFQDHGAAQCGICMPGMIVAAVALLRAQAQPDAAAVQDALAGVLCRCTGYRKIIDAVIAAGAPPRAARPAAGGVGAAIRRVDGADRISGAARFGDDVAPADALVVRVIRSPHPRAAFRFGDLDAWRDAAGVTAVLTAADVPGRNLFGVIPAFADQPVFAVSETLYRGDAVAAVVGPAAIMAALDLTAFPVVWEALPAVVTPEAALGPGAPLLHAGRAGNVMCRGRVRRGDAAAALARADVTVTARFRTAFVEHAYIEPEAGYAVPRCGRIEVHACTQAPVMDLDALEIILGMDRALIRIVPTAVGGGFGSKLDLSVQPYLALAALKTGRAVRMAYSRGESMRATTKRHPADLTMTIGATRDGRLCGMTVAGDFDTGAYASWGPTVANRVPVHASGPYYVADYHAETRAIHTHNPPSGAFRGFGVPQAAAAQETLFDALAARLGMDALAFRLVNALGDGEPTVCGQVFAAGVGARACLDALGPAWAAARADCAAFNAAGGPLRRGVGLAAGWYGCGNTSLPNPSTIRAGITPAGAIVLHQGAVDIGQGADTVITQIFAAALGVPMGFVRRVGADTDLTPDAGKTSASRQTYVSGNAARLTGLALRAALLRLANAGEGAEIRTGAEGISVAEGARVTRLALAGRPADAQGYVIVAEETYNPPTRPLDADGQGEPYAQFGYAAHLAIVEVDTTLGLVRPLRFVAAHDVGRAINPLLVEGQVQGGIAQGMGMALMEEYIPGRTENLHDYLIPTIGDMPPVDTIIVEVPDAHGPHGAKGLGEHVLIPTAPAILNAIRHATGARIDRLPATPSRVLAALHAAGWPEAGA